MLSLFFQTFSQSFWSHLLFACFPFLSWCYFSGCRPFFQCFCFSQFCIWLCVFFFFAVSGFSLQVWCAEHFFSSFFCFIFVLQLYLLPTIFACFCCSSSKLGFALRFGGLSPQVWPAAFFHIFCCSFIVPAFAFLFGALHFRCSLSPLPTFDLACPLSTLHAPLTVFSGSQLISCDCFPFWSCSPSIPFKLLEKCIKLFWCGALSSNTKVGTCKPFFP